MNKKRLLILTWLLLLIFFILVFLIQINNESLKKINLSFNSFITKIQNKSFSLIAEFVSYLFGISSLFLLTLILIILFVLKGEKNFALFFLIAIGVSELSVFILKEITKISRPANAIVFENSFSFPSGHAVSAVVFFGLLTFFILKKNKSKFLKKFSVIFSLFMIFLVGFSRLYLNVHWLSDVIGGFLIGAIILFGSVLAYENLWARKDFKLLH